jgi:hypothetical protein
MTIRLLALSIVLCLPAACATRTDYVDLFGEPAAPGAAQRTIVIQPDTRYVNVEGGQVVRFIAGDKEFAWNFFVARTVNSFDLNEVAPPGILAHTVRAYVSQDPRYIGGDESQ